MDNDTSEQKKLQKATPCIQLYNVRYDKCFLSSLKLLIWRCLSFVAHSTLPGANADHSWKQSMSYLWLQMAKECSTYEGKLHLTRIGSQQA